MKTQRPCVGNAKKYAMITAGYMPGQEHGPRSGPLNTDEPCLSMASSYQFNLMQQLSKISKSSRPVSPGPRRP